MVGEDFQRTKWLTLLLEQDLSNETKQKPLEKMELSCIWSSEDYGRSFWWIKAKPHSCTQHLAPQLSQRYSIHEEVLSMTFGSTFHLQYVQRLQNSHGRTPCAVLKGSCYRHDESHRFCPAIHCIPPTETSKILAEKKIGSWVFECLGEFGWYGPGDDSSRATSPEICLIVPL